MNDFILKEIKPDDPNYFKPLDELIEDLGHAEPAKQYGNVIITVEDLTDALYYLQLFQKHEERVRGQLADLKEEFRPNDPLTWDELKGMEGKPVWIWLSPRIKNTPGSGRWEIIYKFNPIGGNKNLFEMEMESRSRFKRKYQGDLWQAYRKERFDE